MAQPVIASYNGGREQRYHHCAGTAMIRPVLLSAAFLCVPGYRQLRIVQYNVAGLNNSSAFTTVINAIDDATINGVVKPIDAHILQEVESSDITAILEILRNSPEIDSRIQVGLGIAV
jgi:hypothetical protein